MFMNIGVITISYIFIQWPSTYIYIYIKDTSHFLFLVVGFTQFECLCSHRRCSLWLSTLALRTVLRFCHCLGSECWQTLHHTVQKRIFPLLRCLEGSDEVFSDDESDCPSLLTRYHNDIQSTFSCRGWFSCVSESYIFWWMYFHRRCMDRRNFVCLSSVVSSSLYSHILRTGSYCEKSSLKHVWSGSLYVVYEDVC